MTEVDPRLAELSARYRASLTNKRASVELAWRSFCTDAADRHNRLDLMRVLHRLAGSAPSYGYERIGALASKAEARLGHAAASADSAAAADAVQTMVEDLEPMVASLLDALSAEIVAEPARTRAG
jgi:HPt (histidine-containing phosphotransfer) domain-containing protein